MESGTESHLSLTKEEFGMLIDSSVATRSVMGSTTMMLVLNVLAAASLVVWNVIESHYENTWLTVLLVFNGISLYSLGKQHRAAIGLIAKFKGDSKMGRRAMDTAVPEGVGQDALDG